MREVLFRGYNKENGQWYYGFLTKTAYSGEWWIDGRISGTVDEDSIGQYTGFKDRDGNKIFEGDIVNVYTQDGGKIDVDEYWTIVFYDGAFQRSNNAGILYNMCEICDFMWYEVTSNVYENSLKEQNDGKV